MFASVLFKFVLRDAVAFHLEIKIWYLLLFCRIPYNWIFFHVYIMSENRNRKLSLTYIYLLWVCAGWMCFFFLLGFMLQNRISAFLTFVLMISLWVLRATEKITSVYIVS